MVSDITFFCFFLLLSLVTLAVVIRPDGWHFWQPFERCTSVKDGRMEGRTKDRTDCCNSDAAWTYFSLSRKCRRYFLRHIIQIGYAYSNWRRGHHWKFLIRIMFVKYCPWSKIEGNIIQTEGQKFSMMTTTRQSLFCYKAYLKTQTKNLSKKSFEQTRNRPTFCGTRYLFHCHAIAYSSCFLAIDALVSLQPILSLNKNGWLPWQQGSAVEKLKWHHRIARARK